jgi:hypothetical protein
MLNVGPRGDGTLDPKDVAILSGIGKWMKVNGDSIHGTTRTPLAVQAWGESTAKGKTLYLHVFHWPSDGKLLVGGLKSNVTNAYLLADSSRTALKVSRLSDLDVQIDLPPTAPDATDSVIAVDCDGGISTDPARLLSASQENVLRVFDGQLAGDTIKFGQGKKDNAYVEQWTEATDSVGWTVRVNQPTTFTLSATYDAESESAGGKYRLKNGSKQVCEAAVKAGIEQSQRLGEIQLEPGVHEIRLEPAQIAGTELMRLRNLTLTAVRHESSSR